MPGEVIRSFDDAAQRLLHTRDIITVTELFSVIGQVLSYCNRVKNKAPDKLVDLVVDIYRKIEVQDEKAVQRACIFMSSLSKLGLDPAHSIFKDIQNQLLQADTPFYCVNIRNYAEVYRTLAYLHSYANSKLRKKIESVLLKPQWLVRMSDQEVDSIVWSCRYFQYPSLEILAAVEKEILNREDLRQFSAKTFLDIMLVMHYLKYPSRMLIERIGVEFKRRSSMLEFSALHYCHAFLQFTKHGLKDYDLFIKLAYCLTGLLRVQSLEPGGYGMIMWSLGQLKFFPRQLVEILVFKMKCDRELMFNMPAVSICNVLYGMSTLRYLDENLLDRLLRKLVTGPPTKPKDLYYRQLVQALLTCAYLQCGHMSMIPAIKGILLQQCHNINKTKTLVCAIWSLVVMGLLTKQQFGVLYRQFKVLTSKNNQVNHAEYPQLWEAIQGQCWLNDRCSVEELGISSDDFALIQERAIKHRQSHTQVGVPWAGVLWSIAKTLTHLGFNVKVNDKSEDRWLVGGIRLPEYRLVFYILAFSYTLRNVLGSPLGCRINKGRCAEMMGWNFVFLYHKDVQRARWTKQLDKYLMEQMAPFMVQQYQVEEVEQAQIEPESEQGVFEMQQEEYQQFYQQQPQQIDSTQVVLNNMYAQNVQPDEEQPLTTNFEQIALQEEDSNSQFDFDISQIQEDQRNFGQDNPERQQQGSGADVATGDIQDFELSYQLKYVDAVVDSEQQQYSEQYRISYDDDSDVDAATETKQEDQLTQDAQQDEKLDDVDEEDEDEADFLKDIYNDQFFLENNEGKQF